MRWPIVPSTRSKFWPISPARAASLGGGDGALDELAVRLFEGFQAISAVRADKASAVSPVRARRRWSASANTPAMSSARARSAADVWSARSAMRRSASVEALPAS